ncbi:rootletin-like [Rhagoletis pomonella]|uniref:rootletin-like n=1 Tax=Rhagoletis pomonella TaxID=28610 RepID=UPI00178187BF|nr:rootletin-like [Rhagoletis pomonella]
MSLEGISQPPLEAPQMDDDTDGHLVVVSTIETENSSSSMRIRNSSDMSEKSATSETRSGVLTYDSGNYSTSSNTSEITCPLDAELHNHCQHVHTLLRERDHALFLAMQDVRKMRSELERLNKSEGWYKKELRSQKRTRLEAIERLYAQERKYMQENQHLQRECMRLYGKCGQIEKETQAKQDKAVQKLVENEERMSSIESADKEFNSFELDQQRSLIDDQQKLINVLRKQKQALLEDLRRLNEEKDTKVLQLQETLAGVEVENTRMTAQCMRLLTERQVLEDTLQAKDAVLDAENVEKLKMQTLIVELEEQCNRQNQMLALKEHEVHEIQQKFKNNIEHETNMDEVHRLSVSYHCEINAKTDEITSLKKSLRAVQIELSTLTELQSQNEEQARHIEQLNFTLEARQCELSNLQETDEEKTQQITELQRNLEKARAQHDVIIESLKSAESSLKNVNRELIALHEQYANMCALCERTRFELELLEIEKGKLKFQADGDKREIHLLRDKLKGYMEHTEKVGAKINEFEAKLKHSHTEKDELLFKLRELERKFTLEREPHKESEKEAEVGLEFKGDIDQVGNAQDFLREHEGDEVDTGRVNLNEEEDSGFLDASGNSVNEKNDNVGKNPSDSGPLRISECSNFTVANNTLMDHVRLQKEILEERQPLAAALEKLVCNGTTALKDYKDSSIISGYDAEECVGIMGHPEQLLQNLDNQNLLPVEKKRIFEAFETLIKRENTPQEMSLNGQEILELKKLLVENKKLKNLLTTAKKQTAEVEPLKLALIARNQKCSELQECASTCSVELRKLQEKLLESHEQHQKSKNEQESRYRGQLDAYEQTIQLLQEENKRLLNELQTVLVAKSDFENKLSQQQGIVQELRGKLDALQTNEIPREIENAHEGREILNLRSHVKELEMRLQVAMRTDEERRNERVRLIRKLLEQQNSKVKQLTESHEQWEELLLALQAAQKLEENTRAELQLKHAELEELNALFAEQNEELRRLQETTLTDEFNRDPAEIEETRRIFQQQVEELQANIGTQLTDSQEKQRKIEELQGKNERLERQLNEDYAAEVAKNQRQMRALQTKMGAIQAERNIHAERVTEMETELQQLKKSKREGLLLPPEFVVVAPRSVTMGSSSDDVSSLSSNGNGHLSNSDSDNNDRMRILTKVLEAEYRRKMKRYDLHIHTLLCNIKKLKKALRAAEQRATNLSIEQSTTMQELRSLQLTRRQLEEMRLKCEQNQSTIKALEQALEMERKKFEASDLGKATTYTCQSAALAQQRDEPAHEVANLIDDYKKLIQQSALATQRPKTSTILDLIQRSNQCVPNLNKLEASVDGLRSDLEHFLSAHATLNMSQIQSGNKLEGPSLMDELRAAAES